MHAHKYANRNSYYCCCTIVHITELTVFKCKC